MTRLTRLTRRLDRLLARRAALRYTIERTQRDIRFERRYEFLSQSVARAVARHTEEQPPKTRHLRAVSQEPDGTDSVARPLVLLCSWPRCPGFPPGDTTMHGLPGGSFLHPQCMKAAGDAYRESELGEFRS